MHYRLPRFRPLSLLPFALGVAGLSAGDKALVDTSDSPHAALYMVDLDDVQWTDGFWAERFEVVKDSMIPYMWELFQDDYESHAWSNFLIAAGEGMGRDGKGEFAGPTFNDGDFLKWFEGVAAVYAVTKDPELDALMDRIVAVVAKAQREDGYLHTRSIIPQRQGRDVSDFADREHFATYNMGHLITAACIHYRATGKRTLLEPAIKAADYIYELCQEKPEELALNAICPSHYMGVMELYRITGHERYRELGADMIDIRSLVPEAVGSDDNQDRVPFREQREAVGHAVRANYLYAGVADVFAENGDQTLFEPIDSIAHDVATKKLYITGMTGALYNGASPYGSWDHAAIKVTQQAYGIAHQLPNITAYNETCATIGYNLWNWRMFALTGESQYADLFEQTLYNGILPGISLGGTEYFYVNPLRKVDDFAHDLRWWRTRQPNIKLSFCCPPNVVRTLAEVQNYVYSLSDRAVWVNLFAGSTLDSEWEDGSQIKLRQETDYPWNGAVKLVVDEAPSHPITLKLRIPAWSKAANNRLRVNGEAIDAELVPGRYYELERQFATGDEVSLDIGFELALYEAHPHAEALINQVAVKYGPLVYCVEEDDLPEGVEIEDLALSPDATGRDWKLGQKQIANTVVQTVTLQAQHRQRESWPEDTLYRPVRRAEVETVDLTLVPYYAWGNRGDGEMSVWLPLQ